MRAAVRKSQVKSDVVSRATHKLSPSGMGVLDLGIMLPKR